MGYVPLMSILGRWPELTVELDTLRDAQLRVSGARGQVEHEHVQASPLDLVQELLEGLHDHHPAPHYGAVLVDEVAHRHGLDAVVCEREELVICCVSMSWSVLGRLGGGVIDWEWEVGKGRCVCCFEWIG